MKALQAAGVRPGEVDVIIGACGVMEQPIPESYAAPGRKALHGPAIASVLVGW